MDSGTAKRAPRIAIIGAGIGGLTAAIALARDGADVTVYEQAAKLSWVGAAINLAPNAVMALDGLGLGEAIRSTAWAPTLRLSRTWDTGEVTSRVELAEAARLRYGAPMITLHRAELVGALAAAFPASRIQLGKRLSGFDAGRHEVQLDFEDGSHATCDALIGADGIHSRVRQALFGKDSPSYTGMVAWRAMVPAADVQGTDLAPFVKWWGPTPQLQLVTFLINRGEDLFVFATLPEAEEDRESWSQQGDPSRLRAAMAGFHPEARAVLEAIQGAFRTALYDRDPMPAWSQGRVTLLGDACHAMTPFMAQGAAMGIEDAVVLSRCLKGVPREGVAAALERYQASRLPRASRVQQTSHGNEWLKASGDADWVYRHDAWQAPLAG